MWACVGLNSCVQATSVSAMTNGEYNQLKSPDQTGNKMTNACVHNDYNENKQNIQAKKKKYLQKKKRLSLHLNFMKLIL